MSRGSGKNTYILERLLEAVHQGNVVAICTYGLDGEPHVCKVYPFRSKYNDR